MMVLAGVVQPEQSVAVALRAGLLDSSAAVEPALQRARKLLEHFRLLALWYPAVVDERLRFGVQMCRARSDDAYIKRAAQRTAQNLRAILGVGGVQPIGDLRELVESFGVPVVFAELPEKIHGITVHEDFDGKWRAVILVNCKDSWTRQRYTLAHELGHIIFRDSQPVIIDDDQEVDESDRVEFRAECFARYFLAPDEALDKYLPSVGGVGLGAVVARVMLHFGISRPAAIRALADLRYASYEKLNVVAASGPVRELMANSRLGSQWAAASEDQYDEGASPWLLDLALVAYRDKYISAQVVADVLGRTEEVSSIEAELVAQGWSR